MALGDTGKAIGATTEALRLRLNTRTGLNVSVGRPDDPAGGGGGGRLNLFLYEVLFDASLKNIPLDDGQPAPLWLVLKYMLTAFDTAGDSDSDTVEAMEFLGEGVRALQELNYLTAPAGLAANYIKAMTPNPEDLKITFDEASPDLLSKLMQGSKDKFHLSVAFEVRPVLIAPAEPRSYSLLVGIDYTPPQTIIGEAGIHIPVLPSMGPTITAVEPESFEVGDTVTVYGTDLHLSNLSVMLGSVELPVTMQRPDRLKFVARADRLTGDRISAGGQPLTVGQAISPTRTRRSNVLVANLLPTVSTVAFVGGLTIIPATMTTPELAHGTIHLTGLLLGRDDDDVILALYRDGQTVRAMDYFMEDASIPGSAPEQTRKRIVMLAADAVPHGTYNIILRAGGAQAKQSPTLVF